jgi:hypothetical protein
MFGAVRLDPRFRFRPLFEAVNRSNGFAVARQHFDIEAPPMRFSTISYVIPEVACSAPHASITAMISLTSQRRVVTPAAIAGVTRNV